MLNNNRTFKDYYKEVGQYKILSSEEERALLRAYQICPSCNNHIVTKMAQAYCPACSCPTPEEAAQDRVWFCAECGLKYETLVIPTYCPFCGADRNIEARNKLIVANLRFVVTIAKRFSSHPDRLQQLISAGNIGLLTAIDKFDISRETRFLTYAAWWIRKEILDEIRTGGIVNLPPHKQKERQRMLKHQAYICVNCGMQIDDTVPKSDYHPCTIKEHCFMPMELELPTSTVFSIDKLPIRDKQTNIEADLIEEDTSLSVRNILRDMPVRERDRFIVFQYYNMPQEERRSTPKSLHQLAALTGITPERVRQIKERTIKDLRVELKKHALKNYTDVCVDLTV